MQRPGIHVLCGIAEAAEGDNPKRSSSRRSAIATCCAIVLHIFFGLGRRRRSAYRWIARRLLYKICTNQPFLPGSFCATRAKINHYTQHIFVYTHVPIIT